MLLTCCTWVRPWIKKPGVWQYMLILLILRPSAPAPPTHTPLHFLLFHGHRTSIYLQKSCGQETWHCPPSSVANGSPMTKDWPMWWECTWWAFQKDSSKAADPVGLGMCSLLVFHLSLSCLLCHRWDDQNSSCYFGPCGKLEDGVMSVKWWKRYRADSPGRKALLLLRSEWEEWERMEAGWQEKGRKGEMGLVCKTKNNF